LKNGPVFFPTVITAKNFFPFWKAGDYLRWEPTGTSGK